MNERIPENEVHHREVVLSDPRHSLKLQGNLRVPLAPVGWVIFAHGTGSSRLSPRNIQVAKALNRAHIATLLFDLLTESESRDRKNVFDLDLLSERLMIATKWLKNQMDYNHTPIAYFGASTGAGAALVAASAMKDGIRAVVSRGGRVDMARKEAHGVTAPVLLIVGGWDEPVLTWNREMLAELPHAQLRVIPRATHLFEEPHALPAVIETAIRFLLDQFSPSEAAASGKARTDDAKYLDLSESSTTLFP
jgi:putative phosphoribosyl transferase